LAKFCVLLEQGELNVGLLHGTKIIISRTIATQTSSKKKNKGATNSVGNKKINKRDRFSAD